MEYKDILKCDNYIYNIENDDTVSKYDIFYANKEELNNVKHFNDLSLICQYVEKYTYYTSENGEITNAAYYDVYYEFGNYILTKNNYFYFIKIDETFIKDNTLSNFNIIDKL